MQQRGLENTSDGSFVFPFGLSRIFLAVFADRGEQRFQEKRRRSRTVTRMNQDQEVPATATDLARLVRRNHLNSLYSRLAVVDLSTWKRNKVNFADSGTTNEYANRTPRSSRVSSFENLVARTNLAVRVLFGERVNNRESTSRGKCCKFICNCLYLCGSRSRIPVVGFVGSSVPFPVSLDEIMESLAWTALGKYNAR